MTAKSTYDSVIAAKYLLAVAKKYKDNVLRIESNPLGPSVIPGICLPASIAGPREGRVVSPDNERGRC